MNNRSLFARHVAVDPMANAEQSILLHLHNKIKNITNLLQR